MSIRMPRTAKIAASVMLGLALSTTAVLADTIRATSGFGPSHVMATKVYPATFEQLEKLTDGKWKGKDTPAGLLAPNEMNTGLRDGITEMGIIILPYFAADYPESGLVAEMSMLGTDNRAISSAVTEYMVNCAECLAEFAKFGQVYLGSDTTTTYAFLSRTPIKSLDDMKGKRIRTAGAVFTRLVEAMGAEPVQMPASELFEGLNSGVIDATYSSIPDLKNANLYEVVKAVSEINQGVFNAAAPHNVSQKLWEKMDNDARTALIKAAQYGQAVGLFGWRDTEKEAREKGAAGGIEFIKPDDAMLKAASDFREKHQAGVAAALTEKGVKDAEAKVKKYTELLAKWEKLVEGADTAEAMADLRYQEIWSKVDLATYGK